MKSVEGAPIGGWVQTSIWEQPSTYISFGSLRAYFVGTAQYSQRTRQVPASLSLAIAPVVSDTFDFHTLEQDPGTGWMDHALARLQANGGAKPFSIEGRGPERKLVIFSSKNPTP